MSDLIEREAAIEAVKQAIYNHDSAIMRLTELPSVTQKSGNPQPSEHFIDGVHAMGYREGYKDAQKQKSGKWIKHNTGHSIYYDCSECSCLSPNTEVADGVIWKLSKYCPDCGAKMESEDKE